MTTPLFRAHCEFRHYGQYAEGLLRSQVREQIRARLADSAVDRLIKFRDDGLILTAEVEVYVLGRDELAELLSQVRRGQTCTV